MQGLTIPVRQLVLREDILLNFNRKLIYTCGIILIQGILLSILLNILLYFLHYSETVLEV